MPFCALAMLPLIDTLKQSCNVHQVWYADDALATGKLVTIKCWWDKLCLGVQNSTCLASLEYASLVKISAALTQVIFDQQPECTYDIYTDQCQAK